MVNDPDLDELVLVERLATPLSVSRNSLNHFDHLDELFAIFSHSGMASRSTRSLIRGCKPCSVATSTGQPKSVCTSIKNPPRSRRLRPGSSSTRKSRSLSAVASPRAAEPKIRTFRAPYRRAILKISARLSLRRSDTFISRYPFDPDFLNCTTNLSIIPTISSGLRTSFAPLRLGV